MFLFVLIPCLQGIISVFVLLLVVFHHCLFVLFVLFDIFVDFPYLWRDVSVSVICFEETDLPTTICVE